MKYYLILFTLLTGVTNAQKFKQLSENYELIIKTPPPIEKVTIIDKINSGIIDFNEINTKYFFISNNILKNTSANVYFDKKKKLIEQIVIKNDSIEFDFHLNENQIIKFNKKYSDFLEETSIIDSVISVKYYKNDTLIKEIEYKYIKKHYAWLHLEKKYENSKLISLYDYTTRIFTTFYENGTTKSKQEQNEKKEYDINGDLTYWRKNGHFEKRYKSNVLISEFYKNGNGVFIRKVYNEYGKLLKTIMTDYNSLLETTIEYNGKGSILKKDEQEITPPPTEPQI